MKHMVRSGKRRQSIVEIGKSMSSFEFHGKNFYLKQTIVVVIMVQDHQPMPSSFSGNSVRSHHDSMRES